MKRVKAVLLSVGIMTAISAALLALIALILSKMGSLPRTLLPIITTVAGCLAVFLGGFFSSMYAREKGILFGMGSGVLFSVCAVLISVLVFQNPFTVSSVGKLAAFLISGSIGGILGVNRKSRVKF